MSEIEERLAQVRARIAEAERRSPYGQEVTLVAVTKFHPLARTECRKWKRREGLCQLLSSGIYRDICKRTK